MSAARSFHRLDTGFFIAHACAEQPKVFRVALEVEMVAAVVVGSTALPKADSADKNDRLDTPNTSLLS